MNKMRQEGRSAPIALVWPLRILRILCVLRVSSTVGGPGGPRTYPHFHIIGLSIRLRIDNMGKEFGARGPDIANLGFDRSMNSNIIPNTKLGVKVTSIKVVGYK